MNNGAAVIEDLQNLARSSAVGLELEPDQAGVGITLLEPRLHFHHGFVTGALARRAAQSSQALLKACNNKQRNIRHVLDLTAGWGADSLTLANHGRRVTMLEQDTLLFNILAWSLRKLKLAGGEKLAGRMEIFNADATEYLARLETGHGFDCLYLDPMFPTHKSGARPAKEMQILQALVGNVDIETCFELALGKAHKRVVVKRPLKAPPLGGRKPGLVYREKSIRFDVYLVG